jgi:hypothetical protein
VEQSPGSLALLLLEAGDELERGRRRISIVEGDVAGDAIG